MYMYHYKKPSLFRMDRAFLPVIARYLLCCRYLHPQPPLVATSVIISSLLLARAVTNPFHLINVLCSKPLL